MKIRMKIVNSEYNQETGRSTTWVEYKGRVFKGYSFLHEDDRPHASRIMGCYYAEIKATIKALKYEYQNKRKEVKLYENFVKSVQAYKTFDAGSDTAKAMFRQLNRRKKELERIKNNIIQLENHLELSIKDQDTINQRLDRLYQSKNV